MGWFTAIVVYVLIWWTVLFAVLPFGTRPVSEADRASGWRGAPARPMLWRKILATTLVAAVLWVGAVAVISGPWMSFRLQALHVPYE
jgi:predicted secreted protein